MVGRDISIVQAVEQDRNLATHNCPPLSTLLGIETLLDPLFKKSKEPLHVSERRFGIVIVIHQSVFVMVALCQILVNHKTRLLHCCTPVLELPGNFLGRSLQRAIQAVGPRFCRALPVVCAIPPGWRIEKFASSSDDTNVILAHGRTRVRRIAGV
jgi:hypothetical protein